MMRRILHTDMDLNKGAWRPAEDFLLKEYIEAHGEGNWRTLPLNAGLLRSGRSCRLRWMNYLRPNLKRGHITPEEEELIIRLHKLLGNRWSLIAGRMPGRTDNEIKNYWNTHLSKKLCDHKRSLDPSHNQEECAPAKKVATGKKNINNNGHFGSAELSPRNDQDTGYSVRKQTTSWYDEVERFLMEAEEPSKPTNIHCCDVCTDWTNYANCKQFKWETGSNVCHAEVQPNILSVIPAGMITLLLELNYSLHLNGNPQMPNPITVCTTPQNLWYMVNDHIQPSQFAEQSLEALTDPYF